MNLSEVANGQRFRVSRVTVTGEIGKRIAEMGFNEGTQGRVVRRALLGDPIEICVLGYHVSLRKAEAEGVEVQTVSHFAGNGGRKCRCGLGRDKASVDKDDETISE